jgi:hypothetical protein
MIQELMKSIQSMHHIFHHRLHRHPNKVNKASSVHMGSVKMSETNPRRSLARRQEFRGVKSRWDCMVEECWQDLIGIPFPVETSELIATHSVLQPSLILDDAIDSIAR